MKASPRTPNPVPRLLRYGGAALAVALATAARLLLDPVLGDHTPFLTYLLALVLTAYYGGRGPALAALALSWPAAAFFVLPPRGSFAIHGPEHQVGFALFTLVGLAVAVLGGSLRSAQRRAEREALEVADQRELLHVTLASIGDAVITTDAKGYVTFLNPVAQALTGWAQSEAVGQPLDEVFTILHEGTRRPVDNPAARVLREGAVVGLGNHTVLVSRGGTERAIDDSAAPIRDGRHNLIGVVLVFRDVSERRRVERALRESEAEYRRIVETANEGIWTLDADARITFINRRLADMLGYRPDEMLGRLKWYFVAPGDEGRWRQLFERRRAGVSEEADVCFRHKDGRHVWALMAARPVHDEEGRFVGALDMFTDVTGRRRAEQTARFLAEASAALAGLVDYESTLQKVTRLAVPFFADWCAVDMAGEDGSIRRLAVAHVDPAKVELAHELQRRYPPDPQAKQGVPHILRSGQSEIIADITDALLVETVKDGELLRILRELGLRSYIGVPLEVRGRVLGALTFIASESGRRYDAADLAAAQDLAHRAAVAIENARLYQELREADRRKDEFLAMLAHELRNPLAPIRNSLQILRARGVDGATAERAREMMERQVQHLVRLVDDLLDVSRIMRDKIELRKERVELGQVVARAVETAHPAFDAQGHELTVALLPEPVWVEADPIRLSQVIANLLNNAAKYTERAGRVWLTVQRQGADVLLRVKDTGVGMPPEMLPRLFRLFVQAERSLARSQGGLGIGLALVKKLVEMHGGSVTAASAGPGQGSEFTVRLPTLPGPDGKEDGKAPEGRPAMASPRLRILVVDDNVDAAESLALLLRLLKQDVRVAHDGPSALEVAQSYQPDLIILDIGLPGLSGYDVARRLRQQPEFRDTLLAAMTGYGQEEDRRLSQEAGFDLHLTKPVEPGDLEKLLARPKAGHG
jgi:PAS domain S-box-containing protein